MDALTASKQIFAQTSGQMAWPNRDKTPAFSNVGAASADAPAKEGSDLHGKVASLKGASAIEETPLPPLAVDRVSISASGLRASIEKAWEAMYETENILEIPGVEKIAAKDALAPVQVRTDGTPQPTVEKEYDGIPFIASDIGSYAGGQGEVSTGNIDTRSERLKAIMDGKEARDGLELDKGLALSSPGGAALIGENVLQSMPEEKQKASDAVGDEQDSTDENNAADTEDSGKNENAVNPGGIPFIPTNLDTYGGGQAEVAITPGRAEEHVGGYVKGILEGLRAEAAMKQHQNKTVVGTAADELEKQKEKETEDEKARLAAESGTDAPGVTTNTTNALAQASAQIGGQIAPQIGSQAAVQATAQKNAASAPTQPATPPAQSAAIPGNTVVNPAIPAYLDTLQGPEQQALVIEALQSVDMIV